jgi:thiol-disulfide isomerase/thioredoxin
MKRIFTIVIIGLVLVSCKKETRTNYLIDGNAEGVYNGIRVYLKYSDEKGNEITVDTAVVFDGKFKMTGSIDQPSMHFFKVNNVSGKAMFMLENSEIDVSINKENMTRSAVSGSESNIPYIVFQENMKKIQNEGKVVMSNYEKTRSPQEAAKKDSPYRLVVQLRERIKAYPIKFIKENNDADYSLYLLQSEVNNPKIDVNIFMDAYQNLSTRLKETDKGKKIEEKLLQQLKKIEKTQYLEIGKIAPTFEAPTADGTLVSLDELKGKVTIIDFWAAWCGPCRRENPNVVRVYEKYHDQGLEIIGVSLDGQRRQKNPKQTWLDAIEKDKLTWTHVSHLKYFEDPVAKLYNITSIPATFILDKDGRIVAKGLRGKALELKVQELSAQ